MSIIQNKKQLIEVYNKVRDGDIVAIDTEFMRVRTYYPILCLVQININEECFAIDTLVEDMDLKPLFDIIDNDKVTKIFHSTRQDLEVIYQEIKKVPKNIIDTQVMANFCGFDFNTSYAKLVKEFFDIDLDKGLQRSDWKKRPLTQEQIEYALSDVVYLPRIVKYLKEILIKNGREEWFKEEMEKVLDLDNYDVDNSDLYKKFSTTNKTPTYQRITRLLVPWRDELSKKLDIPRSFVLRDDVLNKIAIQNPQNIEELEVCYEKNRPANDRTKKEIMSVIKGKGDNNDDPIEKFNFRLSKKQEEIFDGARSLLKKNSKSHNMQPQFIINQTELKNIVVGYKEIEELLSGWRYEVFGKDLNNYLK